MNYVLPQAIEDKLREGARAYLAATTKKEKNKLNKEVFDLATPFVYTKQQWDRFSEYLMVLLEDVKREDPDYVKPKKKKKKAQTVEVQVM